MTLMTTSPNKETMLPAKIDAFTKSIEHLINSSSLQVFIRKAVIEEEIFALVHTKIVFVSFGFLLETSKPQFQIKF